MEIQSQLFHAPNISIYFFTGPKDKIPQAEKKILCHVAQHTFPVSSLVTLFLALSSLATLDFFFYLTCHVPSFIRAEMHTFCPDRQELDSLAQTAVSGDGPEEKSEPRPRVSGHSLRKTGDSSLMRAGKEEGKSLRKQGEGTLLKNQPQNAVQRGTWEMTWEFSYMG